MESSDLQRPIGFSPSEISALINEVVVEQHAEEAAFLWTMRDQAVLAPNYALKDLERLDERVEAHLDGLRIAGQVGFEACRRALEGAAPGEVFAAGVLGIGAADEGLIQKVLAFSGVEGLRRGLVSALGWLPFEKVAGKIGGFLSSEHPEVRRIGVAASAVHRVDPGLPLRDAIADENPFLRARALRTVGELGSLELLPKLRSGFADSNQSVRFAAAWSATRLSPSVDSLAVLRRIVESGGHFSVEALQIAIRRMDLASAKSWQALLGRKNQNLRIAVIAAGAIGDPSLIPWIVENMNLPPLARVAGEAFSMITGVDLAYEDLDGDEPPGFEAELKENADDEDVSMDLDEKLRWPVPALVTKWWNKHRDRFESGKRYLRGKEIAIESLRETLTNGKQRERAVAALELSLRYPMRPLFEVRARAQIQSLELKRWS
jgi:uncharacterized protein (TIGR02270 family)